MKAYHITPGTNQVMTMMRTNGYRVGYVDSECVTDV